MIVYVRDRFLPDTEATVSIYDRGFLYGDGLFETLRFYQGRPFRWREHLLRFQRGAEQLQIPCPRSEPELRAIAGQLVERNQMPDAILRITLSRGPGGRGYFPADCRTPTLVMTLRAPPQDDPSPRWRLICAKTSFAMTGVLGGIKHCSRLANVLARGEAEAVGADEALLLNAAGEVVEGAASNLFWFKQGSIFTPPIEAGALPGVTRGVVTEICRTLEVKCQERSGLSGDLVQSEGVFLSVSSLGLIEAESLDGTRLEKTPWFGRLRHAYNDLVRNECQA